MDRLSGEHRALKNDQAQMKIECGQLKAANEKMRKERDASQWEVDAMRRKRMEEVASLQKSAASFEKRQITQNEHYRVEKKN